MNILLVNDDGIQYPLLSVMVRAAASRGHCVRVCAPSRQQSAKAHSLTFQFPLIPHNYSLEYADESICVDGTPADCTRVGLHLWKDTDIVISGMNDGWNVGTSTYVSGTVGAAREAAFRGMPAMAVSKDLQTPESTALFFADWCILAAEKLIHYPTPPASVCNLNVPNADVCALKPPVICEMDTTPYLDDLIERTNPRGNRYFWTAPEVFCDKADPDSDMDYLRRGHITCTFLTPIPCKQEQFSDFLQDL